MGRVFHDEDLSSADFAGAELADADFQRCLLAGASFRHCDLSGATFDRCRALPPDGDGEGVDFSYANLREARFEHCDLTMAVFVKASAYDLRLTHCHLQGADFSGCDFCLPIRGASTLASFSMHGCNFAFGDLSNTYLKECVLTDNRMIDVLANHCCLADADLSGSDLNGLTGQGLDLSGADLRRASFNTLDPRRVDLTGVRMGLAQGLQVLASLEIVVDPEAP